jgi:hypothetical protein
MSLFIPFWMLVFLCCFFSSVFGGTDGKVAAVIILAASLLSSLDPETEGWSSMETFTMYVDVATLVAFSILAFRSHSYWPAWVCAFQFNTVATHLAVSADFGFQAIAYEMLASFWAVPIFVVTVLGILLDNNGWYKNEGLPKRLF